MDTDEPSRPAETRPSAARSRPKPKEPTVADEARRLGRWLYTHNPFYAISAALVFLGLRSSFDTGGESFESQALMIALAGYTALLAGAACFLIRFGKVWDDVRSVLLVVVLMFLAISVTFDDVLAARPGAGAIYFLCGLAFAVVTSETLLWGMPLRLPALFRGPYYLLLTLFFVYPVALSPLFGRPDDPRLHWGLFGFSAAAGLAMLWLLPAVRRGPDYVRRRAGDCPWPWPVYPWVLFGFLALGVCGRAYYLCVSFLFVRGSATIFGPYFLVPLLLALNVLLLEMGIVARRPGVMRAALAAPIGLLLLAITPGAAQAADLGFLATFTATLGGTPLFVTLAAVSALYLVAALRRVGGAIDAFSAALCLLTVCGPGTYGPATMAMPWAAPLAAAACLQLALACRQRDRLRLLAGIGCMLAAAAVHYRGTSLTAVGGLLPLHAFLAAVLLVGAIGHDRFARLVQGIGAALLLVAGTASLLVDPASLGDVPPLSVRLYPAAAVATAAAYGYLVSNPWYLASAGGVCFCWLSLAGWHAYRHLRQLMAGLDYVIWGGLSLLVAVLISLAKASLLRRRPLGKTRSERGPVDPTG